MEKPFTILITTRTHPYNICRMTVEMIYDSPYVQRFKIIGGKKEIIIQKLLNQKNHNWKLLKHNFQFHPFQAESAMPDIIAAIEQHLNPPALRAPHPKNNW